MKMCETYKIPCPYKLSVWDELPCYATQEQCDVWRKKWVEASEDKVKAYG